MLFDQGPIDRKWLLSGVDPNSLSEHSIRNDMWDREDWDYVESEIPVLQNKVEDLCDVTPTGEPLMADYFWSILKAEPEQLDVTQMKPTHIPNHYVQTQISDMPEWAELRRACQGDIVGAAMATIHAEPELATLAERQKKRQEQAQKLQEEMQSLAEAKIEQTSIEELVNELEGEEPDEQLSQQLQDAADAVQAAEDAVEEAASQLEKGLEQDMPAIRAAMGEAMSEAAEDIRESSMAAHAYGKEHADLRKMSVKERMALAKKLNTPRLQQIAEVFGAIEEMRFTEQKRKVDYLPEEIHDVTMGRDLKRALAVELMRLTDPVRRALFLRDFHSGKLLQYDLRGTENKAKGGIIYQQDDSGSMGGDKSVWAAAMGLNLLNVAKEQKRSFVGIHFGSKGHTKIMVFKRAEDFTPERIIEFCESFYGGGPLRIDQRVATPDGWTPIGSIKVGDEVFGPDGLPTSVLGVFPQGELNLHRVTFTDGAEVICDDSHLWTVKRHTWKDWKTVPLRQILDDGLSYTHASGQWFKYRVPVTDPLQLPTADLPLDPYLLGYLLGDGQFGASTPRVACAEPEADQPWRASLPAGVTVRDYEKREGACPIYGLGTGPAGGHDRLNPVSEGLREIGLWGVNGSDKFIPESYLWASEAQRWALLQGLCDSDGHYAKPGRVEFSSVSPKLVEGAVQLVQSLGGLVTVSPRQPSGKGRQVCYRVAIQLDTPEPPFRMSRKAIQWQNREHPLVRSIASVEPVERADAICILVDRADGLFLTESMVVTHNTDFETPMDEALKFMQEEYLQEGRTSADIVMCTDGEANVGDAWFREFQKEQERLDFAVWGIQVGHDYGYGTLQKLTDGKVLTVRDFISGSDVRTLLRSLG